MIDYNEIEREIERLEQSETTYGNCERLSILYNVRNNAAIKSRAAQSEFMDAVENMPMDTVLRVLDEHFECIRIIYPKEYQSVIERLRRA